MSRTRTVAATGWVIKTGRRDNPAIDGPRDNTVCFMLSNREKLGLDRIAFCLNLTRSGLLANMVAAFIDATDLGQRGKAGEDKLSAYLAECRAAVKARGALAVEIVEAVQKPKK